MSGNIGISFTPDLANRSRVIRLFYDKEDTNAREFENPNLHKWVLDNREKVISAMYSLILNWVKKNMPAGSVKFSSFPEWARVCGGVMESAGYTSPCNPNEDALTIGGDVETQDMKILFEVCEKGYPDNSVSMEEIKDVVFKEEIFTNLDFEKGRADLTKFGKILVRFEGRILSGIKMLPVNKNAKGSRRAYIFSKVDENMGN